MALVTRGRFLVRTAWASRGDSKSWLMALAEPEVRKVPMARERRTEMSVGMGESASPVVELSTTRVVRRDFVSWA